MAKAKQPTAAVKGKRKPRAKKPVARAQAKPKAQAVATVKDKGGRPGYVRDEKAAKAIHLMVGYGIHQERIAEAYEISKPTLQKYYPRELLLGKTDVIAKVAASLVKKALGNGPQSVAAAIFFLKTQAGWREPPIGVSPQNPDGTPLIPGPTIPDEDNPLAIYTDEELAQIEAITERAAARNDSLRKGQT